jgi:Ran GTPase-activating protein (RanGAP) involved in mRNA processing and transport
VARRYCRSCSIHQLHMATVVSGPNPLRNDNDDDVEDASSSAAGATHVRRQAEKSTVKAVETATGQRVNITTATLARLGGGMGNLASQALLVIGWLQTFSLVSLIQVVWPVWWYSLWGWLAVVIEFPFKVLVPVQLIFPEIELDGVAQYAAVMFIQPLLGVYSVYRYYYFYGYTFTQCCGMRGDADQDQRTKGWVTWNTGMGWVVTLVGWLCVWILPAMLWILFIEPLELIQEAEVPHPSVSNASHSNTSASINATNTTNEVTAIHESSSRDHYMYEVPLAASTWICLFAFVPFVVMYKIILRSAYHTSQNRNEEQKLFFGHWARKECQVLIFLVVTTHLSAVVTTLHHFRSERSWEESMLHCGLCMLYGLVPPSILLRLCKTAQGEVDDLEAEQRAEGINRKIEEAEAEGNEGSFVAGVFATVRPFEPKYWFGKPALMVEKVALAFVVLGFDDVSIQMYGALVVLGIGKLLFILTRPFALAGEDFTESVARGSNSCVLVIGILVHHNSVAADTGDWLLIVVSAATLLTFVCTLGPVRTVRELRAFVTHQTAASQMSGYNRETIKALKASEVATLPQVTIDLMSTDQLAWLVTEHGDALKQSTILQYIVLGNGVKLSLVDDYENENLDAAGRGMDSASAIVLAWWLTTEASAAINSLTVSSTGNMRDQKAYTVTVGKPTIDLISKNLGSADINLLTTWIQRPQVCAAINSLALGSNPIGNEAMIQLLDVLRDVSLTSFDISKTNCGVSTATELAELLAEDSKFKTALASLNLSGNTLTEWDRDLSGLVALDEAIMPLKTLTSIDLSDCGIMFKGVTEVATFISAGAAPVEVVILDGNPMGYPCAVSVKVGAMTGVAVKKGVFAAVDGRFGEVLKDSTNGMANGWAKLKWLKSGREEDCKVDKLTSVVAARTDLIEDYSHVRSFGEAISGSKVHTCGLANCNFNPATLATFVDSITWETTPLASLNLSGNAITKYDSDLLGLVALGEAIVPAKNLVSVDLSMCGIGVKGLTEVAKFISTGAVLTSVHLSRTYAIDEDARRALQEGASSQQPGIELIWD